MDDQTQKTKALKLAAALEMKRNGATFRELGEILGVSRQRAHQLLKSNELTKNILDCESALISMVQQYLYRPLDRYGELTDNIYQRDQNAGEEAFHYLVERGLAVWIDDDHYAIRLVDK